jgi:hypothetical protein
MGNLFDKLCSEAVEKDEYFGQQQTKESIRKSWNAGVKGKSQSLPAPFNKSKAGQKEKDIQKAILAILKEVGVRHWRVSLGNKIARNKLGEAVAIENELAGFPDIMCIIDGILIGIEVKKYGGKLSEKQLKKLSDIQESGGIYIVGISENAALFVSKLKGLKYEKKIEACKKISEKQNFICPVI